MTARIAFKREETKLHDIQYGVYLDGEYRGSVYRDRITISKTLYGRIRSDSTANRWRILEDSARINYDMRLDAARALLGLDWFTATEWGSGDGSSA